MDVLQASWRADRRPRKAIAITLRPHRACGARNDKDQLLTIKEAAAVLNATEDWLYRHYGRFGGFKLGNNQVRISRKAIEAYIQQAQKH